MLIELKDLLNENMRKTSHKQEWRFVFVTESCFLLFSRMNGNLFTMVIRPSFPQPNYSLCRGFVDRVSKKKKVLFAAVNKKKLRKENYKRRLNDQRA